MERNEICTDFFQIISGSSNPLSSAYTEAAATVAKNDNALRYLKNFIASIENVASKKGSIDSRICASKGNVQDFSGYDNIEKSIKFLSTHKTPSGNAILSDLSAVYYALEKYKSFYTAGYSKNNMLLKREYECAVYLLVTGLAMALSFCFEVADASGTTKVIPKAKAYFGTTGKKLHEMATELAKKSHEEYLDQIEKLSEYKGSTEEVKEGYLAESAFDVVKDVINMLGAIWQGGKAAARFGLNAVKTVKQTVFGIVPLIRSVIYLSYKRKADTILALEQNIIFLERNIDILTNKQGVDPAKKQIIINKQKAKIETFKKKAEKLRAQLEEGEKEAAAAIAAENPKMKTPAGGDDDFVLERGDNQ